MRKTKNLIAAFCGATMLLASMNASGAHQKLWYSVLREVLKVLILLSIQQEQPLTPLPGRFSTNCPNSKEEPPRLDQVLLNNWDISADGTEYTFHLRKGVKFHTTKNFTPTRDFNADDVVFTFMRQFDKNHPYHKVGDASYEYFNSMSMPDLLKEIVKVDDYTVKFILNRPEAPLIANLAMDFASIFSAEYADKMMKAGTPDVIDFEPVGTGPFQLVAYQKDAVIRYKAHPDYWAGKAPIDNLVFAITPDASVRYQKLKAGECHVMPYPNPADLEAMKKDADINLLEKEGLNVGYLAYNTKMAPFDNPKVRKALNMAINKQAILDAVFQGAGKLPRIRFRRLSGPITMPSSMIPMIQPPPKRFWLKKVSQI